MNINKNHIYNSNCSNSLDTSLDSRGVGTTDSRISELLAILVEEEGRHSRDTVISSNLSQLVDVNLVELDVGVFCGELLDPGGNGLAGAAPLGEEVDDDVVLGVLDLLGPLSGAGIKVSFVVDFACAFAFAVCDSRGNLNNGTGHFGRAGELVDRSRCEGSDWGCDEGCAG